jgi:putative transposase
MIRPSAKRDTGPNALRRGRVSVPGANYFVTLCVEPRLPLLVESRAREASRELHSLHDDGCWHLRCATVMPDHIHVFFTLGRVLMLSQVVARLKTKTQAGLRRLKADWQDNYYDHRLRPEDSVESTIRYIHLNPYRAGLITAQEQWPHFYCCQEDWSWYLTLADDGKPPAEWLR